MINDIKLYVVHYLLFDTGAITDDLVADPGEHLIGQYYSFWSGRDEEEALHAWGVWVDKWLDDVGCCLDFIEPFEGKKYLTNWKRAV